MYWTLRMSSPFSCSQQEINLKSFFIIYINAVVILLLQFQVDFLIEMSLDSQSSTNPTSFLQQIHSRVWPPKPLSSVSENSFPFAHTACYHNPSFQFQLIHSATRAKTPNSFLFLYVIVISLTSAMFHAMTFCGFTLHNYIYVKSKSTKSRHCNRLLTYKPSTSAT